MSGRKKDLFQKSFFIGAEHRREGDDAEDVGNSLSKQGHKVDVSVLQGVVPLIMKEIAADVHQDITHEREQQRDLERSDKECVGGVDGETERMAEGMEVGIKSGSEGIDSAPVAHTEQFGMPLRVTFISVDNVRALVTVVQRSARNRVSEIRHRIQEACATEGEDVLTLRTEERGTQALFVNPGKSLKGEWGPPLMARMGWCCVRRCTNQLEKNSGPKSKKGQNKCARQTAPRKF